jgi:predicted ester cyclase
MAHELAGTLQQTGRIWQRCAAKEPHVYVRSEYIDVAEGRISQTCHGTSVMQKLPDFVPALAHHLKPLLRDCSQFACMLFHPRVNGGIMLDCAVESQQIRFHRRSIFNSG